MYYEILIYCVLLAYLPLFKQHFLLLLFYFNFFNSTQDGWVGEGEASLYQLYQLLQMSELAPKTLQTLVSNLLPHFCKISRPYLVPVTNY